MKGNIPPAVTADAQVYEALAKQLPDLDMTRHPNTKFQFMSVPMEAAWYRGDTSNERDWCEYVSARRDGYYVIGAGRFSQAYRTMLLSADQSRLGEMSNAVDKALEKLNNDPEMHIAGNLAEDAELWDGQSEWMFSCNPDSDIPTDNLFTRSFEGPLGTTTPLDDLLADRCAYNLRVKGVGIYEIARGGWYQESLVRPDFPLVQGGSIHAEQLFGRQGGLQHTGLKLLVSYEPEMTIAIPANLLPMLMARNSMSAPMMAGGLHFDFARATVLPQANALSNGPSPVRIRIPALKHTPQVWGVLSQCNYL